MNRINPHLAWADFTDILAPMQTRDWGVAVNKFYPAALAGDAQAQNVMGLMYARGSGVEKNYGLALGCFMRSAQSGYSGAKNNIAVMCAASWGVAQDDQVAMKWLYEAADTGCVEAKFNIGLMLYQNRGEATNYKKAIQFFYDAAILGNTQAQATLCEIYYNGNIAPQNFIFAYAWIFIAIGLDSFGSNDAKTLVRDSIWNALCPKEKEAAAKLALDSVVQIKQNIALAA